MTEFYVVKFPHCRGPVVLRYRPNDYGKILYRCYSESAAEKLCEVWEHERDLKRAHIATVAAVAALCSVVVLLA